MILDDKLTNVAIITLYFFGIILLYFTNTEWIGFGFFFIWSLITNIFLFREKFDYVLLTIGSFLLVSLFLIILAIIKLHSQYIKKSEPIKNFPERRRAFDHYKLLFVICQGILLTLLFLNISMNEYYTLAGGTLGFLLIWLGFYFRSHKETDLYPFFLGLGGSIGLVGLISKFQNYGLNTIVKLLLLQGGVGISSYLIFLSHWIYKHSLHVVK
jgi:hypothetical protein